MNPIALLFVFETKHLLADFFLQTEKHLGKFKGGKDWALPLADHCAIHGIMTLLICVVIKPDSAVVLSLVDFLVHFVMDRIKASPDLLGRFKSLDATSYMKAKTNIYEYYRGGHGDVQLVLDAQQKLKSNKIFWWCLGIDQYVHQLTGLFIVWSLCN